MSAAFSSSNQKSTEPPTKRLSLESTDEYPYKPIMVLLGVKRLNSKVPKYHASMVVACVHSARFDQITKWNHRWTEAAVREDDLSRFRHIEFWQTQSFVKFIAHFAQERDASAAVKSTLAKDDDWIENFLMIYSAVREENGFINDVQDSLIDCVLDYLRRGKGDGCSLEESLRSIIEFACDVNGDDSTLADSSHLIKLLTVIALYHAKDLLKDRQLYGDDNGILSKVRDCVGDELLDAFPPSVSTTIAKDPMAEEFDQHCVYHVYGKDKACYRSKLG